MAVLEIRDAKKRFGATQALAGLSFSLVEGRLADSFHRLGRNDAAR